jgi:hypothetical protein
MRRIAIALVLIAAATASANAKAYKLKDFSIKDVETRCASVHGKFFSNPEGTYGCVYSKGVVQCDADQHCSGTLKEAQHRKEHHARPHHHEYHEYRWYPYQQW